MAATPPVTLTSWAEVHDAFRAKDLRQAGYTEGAIVMADCLLDLHGHEHRERRRIENRLFRRDVFAHWEHEVLGATIAATLDPFVAAGGGDLTVIGYRSAMNLTATIAGVDHDITDTTATERLYGIVKTFSAGATLAHSTRDKDEVRAEVRAAMDAFHDELYLSSLERRRALVAEADGDATAEAALPHDVLTTLVRHRERLGLTPEVQFREICFYLQAGAHSTANAFVHTVDELLRHGETHPDDLERARHDLGFVQRCMHESLRLDPASPVAVRTALADVVLGSGRELPAGTTVVLDLTAANRDPSVFGDDAETFRPRRAVPEGVPPWGASFGGGTHACIGAELDGGLEPPRISPTDDRAASGATGGAAGDVVGEDHLFGTVAVMTHAFLAAGGRQDPAEAPALDPTSSRRHFSSYPVVF
ncbi:MAG: cytochrome P450 [Acidimicrobiales bacterium]